MEIIISFTNYDNEPLSEEQAIVLRDYQKIFKINGIEKKIEFYYNNRFDGIEYYKDNNENLDDIFKFLGTKSILITEQENFGDYKMKISTSYTEGSVTNIEKELYLNDDIICIHEIDAYGQFKINDCVKYLYVKKKNESNEYLRFFYNQGGNLKSISGVCYPFSEYNQYLHGDDILLYFPSLLLENPYYSNIDFLPF